MRVYWLLLMCTWGCMGGSFSEPDASSQKKAKKAKRKAKAAPRRAREASAGMMEMADAAPAAPGVLEAKAKADADDNESPAEEGGEAATRAWFPETFLFEPSVITDAAGTAEIATTIPDRLTTWRILALAHSQSGGLAGTTTEFLGTLPAYVEPVIPPFLVSGDRVRLPIQVVNTTDRPLRKQLHVKATGAARAQTAEVVTVPARGSIVRGVALQATTGTIKLKAGFGDVDAIVREIPVLPTGRPLTLSRGGTLATPRSVPIKGPARLDPSSTRIRLMVFPGALSVLRSELARARLRRGAAADAHALVLTGRAPALAAALSADLDTEALRELRIIATQRAFRHTRAPSVDTAALFAEAALAHPDSPVLTRMGVRMVQFLAKAQRPDGSFTGGSGWTVQRVLVSTADAARAARAAANTAPDDPAVRRAARAITIRAGAAIDRFSSDVKDSYTAAAILASGAAPDAIVPELRKRVRDAIEVQTDGSRAMVMPDDVTRGDGGRPSVTEATALAVLALAEDPDAPWVADLGAAVIGAYRPSTGWGDGRTNLVCLAAVMQLFKDPIPDSVEVILELDGAPFASGELNATQSMDPLVLNLPAPTSAGEHVWTVRSNPAVPGLGFSLELMARVPWPRAKAKSGLELDIDVPAQLRVGRPATIQIRAMAPSKTLTEIVHALPAGVQPDEDSLERLITNRTILAWESTDGQVTLKLAAMAPGESFKASYTVIPTLAGTLHTPASHIAPINRHRLAWHLRPATWVVR